MAKGKIPKLRVLKQDIYNAMVKLWCLVNHGKKYILDGPRFMTDLLPTNTYSGDDLMLVWSKKKM